MSTPFPRSHPFLLRRTFQAAAALALLLAVVLMASPAARVFAGEQFRQIGALIFRQLEAGEWSPLPQPTVPAPGDTDRPQSTNLLDDASRMAGFPVLAPGYLPAGYQVSTAWSVDRRDSGIYVVSSFRDGARQQFLLLNQIRYVPGASFEQTLGDNEQLADVTVRGQTGVWITGRLMADPEDRSPAGQTRPTLQATQWLVWQEGELTYTLFGNGLSQAEMIKIAESLDD